LSARASSSRRRAFSEIFERLSSNGANYLRIWTCCHDWAMAIEARKSAWGRSWSWKPPFAPLPGDEESGQLCVRLDAGERGSLLVDPSHSVALRPGTEYVLTGRARIDASARLQVTVGPHELPKPLTSTDQEAWQPLELRFTTDDGQYWLGRTTLSLTGRGAAWIDGLSLKEAAGGPELLWEAAVNRAERGFYNPIDCRLLDDLVEAAEQHGLYLQLCLITRDVYMRDLRNEDSPEYQQAIADAKNCCVTRRRAGVARRRSPSGSTSTRSIRGCRWNGSTAKSASISNRSTSTASAVDQHLESIGPRLPASSQLDVADVHFYLRPVEPRPYADEVEAVLGNAAWLREHAPAKPALIGEFGLADPQWRPTRRCARVRRSSISTMRSGRRRCPAFRGRRSSGGGTGWTQGTTIRTTARWRISSPTSRGRPPSCAKSRPKVSEPKVRVVGLQGDDRAYFWLFDPAASWEHVVIRKRQPETIDGQQIDVGGLQPGAYRVQWWDTRSGEVVRREKVSLEQPVLRLAVPGRWQRDFAGKIVPLPQIRLTGPIPFPEP
jgi:hypothetical protein